MEPDEPLTPRGETISPGEDLTIMGVEQLKDREASLVSELERTRAMMKEKQAGLAEAASLFKK